LFLGRGLPKGFLKKASFQYIKRKGTAKPVLKAFAAPSLIDISKKIMR
jgi:hypothetical protein